MQVGGEVIGVGDLLEGHAVEFFGAVAEQFAEAVVDPLPGAVRVDVGEGAPGQFEDRPEALLTVAQYHFGDLAFGVVHADADHLHRTAGTVAHHRGAGRNPAHFAVGASDTKIAFAATAIGHCLGVHGLHVLDVFRRQVGPEVFVAVDRPAVDLLDVGRVGDFVADQVPLPGDDARAFLGQLHACFAFHDLGGVAPAQVGHRQLDHLWLLDVLQGFFAVAQPDPVDLEKVCQLAQVVVVDFAAAGPFVHRGARDPQGRAHGLQGQLVMLEQFLEAEGETVFQHGAGVLIGAKSLSVYLSCQLWVDGVPAVPVRAGLPREKWNPNAAGPSIFTSSDVPVSPLP
ncbi:hypothetical protein D9M71_459530 [compost metagenome]